MAGLCAPLSTLRRCPRGHLRMTRGRCGSLLLHRDGLAPSTPCRSPGALRVTPGESHVRGAKLLRWNENLILTVSPDSIGELFGPLCRMLFAVDRSSEEPSTARSDRDAVHCVARHAVRCHDLLRHRAVWAVERSAVAHNSGAGARDTEPR